MTYIPDLAPYAYSMCGEPDSAAIGWLDHPHQFPQGPVDPALLDRIWAICRAMGETAGEHSFFYRGFHLCTLCPDERDREWRPFAHRGETQWLGSGEIRVIAANGQVYAAPNLIFHYVRDHQYAPPAPFAEALVNGLAPGSPAFEAALYRLDIQRYRSMPGRLAAAFNSENVEPLSLGLQRLIAQAEAGLRRIEGQTNGV